MGISWNMAVLRNQNQSRMIAPKAGECGEAGEAGQGQGRAGAGLSQQGYPQMVRRGHFVLRPLCRWREADVSAVDCVRGKAVLGLGGGGGAAERQT